MSPFGLYRSLFAPLLVVRWCASVACSHLAVPGQLRARCWELGPAAGVLSLAVIFGALGVAASTFIVSDAYLGERSRRSCAGRALALLGRLVVISILSSLLIGLGFILLIVPGVSSFAGLVLSTVVTVLESPATADRGDGPLLGADQGVSGKGAAHASGRLSPAPGAQLRAGQSGACSAVGGDSSGVAKLVTASLLPC